MVLINEYIVLLSVTVRQIMYAAYCTFICKYWRYLMWIWKEHKYPVPWTTVFQNNSKSPAGLPINAREISSQTQCTLGCEEMESWNGS